MRVRGKELRNVFSHDAPRVFEGEGNRLVAQRVHSFHTRELERAHGTMRSHMGKPVKKKNPAAVAMAMLGASKGGKARAKALSAKERSRIARMAALKRWQGKEP